jgi:hypothetical protein
MDTLLTGLQALQDDELLKVAVSAKWMRKMLTSSSAMKQLPEDAIMKAVKGKTRAGIGGPRKATSGAVLKTLKRGKSQVKAMRGGLNDPTAQLPAAQTVMDKARRAPKGVAGHASALGKAVPLPGMPRVPLKSSRVPKMFRGTEAAQRGAQRGSRFRATEAARKTESASGGGGSQVLKQLFPSSRYAAT